MKERQSIMPPATPRANRAAFLDRDGVINAEVHYLHEVGALQILPGVPEALRLLERAGYLRVVVTNQAGIGRGYYPARAMEAVHAAIQERVAARGASITAFYHCPHHPEAGCACRKPEPGMLLQASADLEVDLPASVTIGDKLTDIEAGRRAGTRTILVRTGYGAKEVQQAARVARYADHVVDDLLAAARLVADQARSTPTEGKEYRDNRDN